MAHKYKICKGFKKVGNLAEFCRKNNLDENVFDQPLQRAEKNGKDYAYYKDFMIVRAK